MERRVKIRFVLCMIALAVAMAVLGVKLGDPRAVWFYCDLLRLC